MTTLHTHLDAERQADLAKDRSNQAQPAVIWLRDLPRALGRSKSTIDTWRKAKSMKKPGCRKASVRNASYAALCCDGEQT